MTSCDDIVQELLHEDGIALDQETLSIMEGHTWAAEDYEGIREGSVS
jgi:hypothetical protein